MQRIAVITLFPELFEAFGSTSLVGRAMEAGLLSLHLEALRPYGLGKHLSVDDTPYGGGSGMLMRVDCLVAALEAVDAQFVSEGPFHRVLVTPQGAPFKQSAALALSQKPRIVYVCGRYEGFDERVRQFVHQEISLGDFVLTGGEVAAMAMIEASARLIPGVLGNESSACEESFSEAQQGGLEYPQYTRPVEFRGLGVPEVLKSGDHAKIAEYRRMQAAERTAVRRADLVSVQSKGKL
ncbi:MAG TPA: tRNA (guanosine(37)-N1)-methyltransferase TrmD [Polyangiaceae bacterium]|nr:tRNA (guanosine(37)-N1)-methyltransferase TrmD [Polyangiaceae bacterium]